MFHCEGHSVRTHDLLEIDPNQFIPSQASAPQWVEEDLRKSPFVVVRRGPATGHKIPIGVRGTERHQRWAAFCHPKLVRSILTPPQLLSRTIPTSRADAIPALRALNLLKDRWMDLVRPWGPGGSVGFELASGKHVARPESDLDIVIYSETRMMADEAKSVCDGAMNLPAGVDIRVQTPLCGFSIREFASRSSAAILLRAPSGIIFGRDPWGGDLRSIPGDTTPQGFAGRAEPGMRANCGSPNVFAKDGLNCREVVFVSVQPLASYGLFGERSNKNPERLLS
jgi:phosphoribosyl-dephospho-CoA transferase